MAGYKLSLNKSSQARLVLSKAQEKEIAAMYSNLIKQVRKEQVFLSRDPSVTASIKKSRLRTLEKQLSAELDSIGGKLNSLIRSNMTQTAESVVKDSITFAESLNVFEIKGAFSHVPSEVVKNLVTGRVYGGDWSLSSSIWSDISSKQAEINKIIAQGVALNKSTYDIAKDLEKYVDPKSMKPWDWNKVYPGTAKQIDYHAQRLARTMVSHAYQQALVTSNMNNPFVKGFKWLTSGSRTCPLCASRAGEVYTAEDLPLDHPNGMCTWVTVMKEEIGSDIANWIKSPSGTYPEMDKYAKVLNPDFGKVAAKTSSAVSKKEIDAVKEYSSASYRGINGYLRGTSLPMNEDATKNYIDLIDSFLDKSEHITDGTKLYRGTSLDELKAFNIDRIPKTDMDKSRLERQLLGKPLSNKAYLSTSNGGLIEHYAGDVEMVIETTVKSKAVDISKISSIGVEKEVLIPRDAELIVKAIEYKGKRMIIHLTY